MKAKEPKRSVWSWIRYNGEKLYDLGINADGTLHNPRGYPESLVRAAVQYIKECRSKSAKEAAETRRRRQEEKVYEVAKGLNGGRQYGPRNRCVICGRGVDDPASIKRGIGSDCWQDVLKRIEIMKSKPVDPGLL